jgi:hypothetical protein
MKKIIYFIALSIILLSLISCDKSKKEKLSIVKEDFTENKKEIKDTISEAIIENKTSDFIPEGFKLFEEIKGDLNKDGIDDCILIIKTINKENIIKHEFRGELDRNRRGIIVLLNENGNYKMVLRNSECFSSENEEGGAYYAPELSLEIKNRNIYIHYAHGRNGYWKYTFRLKKSDFELIGYDSSNNDGGTVNSFTSINFLTKKKLVKFNTNQNGEIDESMDEIFEEKIETLKNNTIYRLSEIKDFDELSVDGI